MISPHGNDKCWSLSAPVKRYRQEGTVVWLLPENTEFEPIRVDLREQSMSIEGVVVGVLRTKGERLQ